MSLSKGKLVGLIGTAKYDGGVTGVFADESTGRNIFFDADVRLNADFGADDMPGTIRGVINNVRDGDTPIEGTPTLMLSIATLGTDSSSLFTGDTSMTFENEYYEGKWGAQFYGNPDDNSATGDDAQPGSVAGTFGAATPEGTNRKSLLGVFGAFKKLLSSRGASQAPETQAKIAVAATADPKEGSITQSSNTNGVDNPITTDFVEVTVTYSIKNGKGMLDYTVVKTAEGDGIGVTIRSTVDKEIGRVQSSTEGSDVELYKKLPEGQLWVDVYTNRELTIEEDTDYLAGGLWVYAPDDTRSLLDYEYGVFGDGPDPFTKENLAGLTGVATYSGPQAAIGVYADSSIGRNFFFEADVSLTANFDTGLGTVSGAIDNFRHDELEFPQGFGGEPVVVQADVPLPGNPTVTLQSASITDVNDGGFFKGSTAITEFKGQAYEGKWGGSFFGNPDSGASGADLQPGSIGGTFGAASTGDGPSRSILGVFGAFKDEE